MTAVKQDGLVLRHVYDGILGDKYIVLESVR